jgi:hypothetical protein
MKEKVSIPGDIVLITPFVPLILRGRLKEKALI